MRLRNLHYFLVVAEELHFARAAVRVHIEPSPLSRAIKELEEDLGTRLFYRQKGRSIQLTMAGEVFREEAHRILNLFENAKTRVNAAANGYRGQLRIGLNHNLAQHRLTKLLALCREEEPRTAIRIMELTNYDMVKALNDDQIDIGFTLHHEPENSLCSKVAWWDRMVIILPKSHPLLCLDKIPLDEVLFYPLIFCHPETCPGAHNIIQRWCDSVSQPLTMHHYISGIESMMMLVAAGYGIGIALESQMSLYDYPNIIIRPVTDDVPTTATFFVTRDKPLSDELSRFINRIHKIASAEEGYKMKS